MLTDKKLQKIKNSIVKNGKLDSGDSEKIYGLPSKSRARINCYAYALGIMHPARNLYDVGFTTDTKYKDISREKFISLICEDLKNLEIKYRIFKINDEIKLRENEYLIQALYVSKELYYREDFHFLRQSKAGFWYAKDGYDNTKPALTKIEILNYEYEDGNSELVKLNSSNYGSKQYIRVAYFAIEEKN